MKLRQGSKRLGIFIFFGIAFSGCVTGDRTGQEFISPMSPSENAGGQATTVTAEGQVKHEETCMPQAEADRIQPPSIEVGLSRQVAGHSLTQPYTRFSCR